MEDRVTDITVEEKELYDRIAALHKRNRTPNHEEDKRSALEIVLAGARKLPRIDLK